MTKTVFNCGFKEDCRYYQKAAELKAENERLKEEYEVLQEKFLNLNCKSYSYLMTLQEIKEIAKGIRNYVPTPREIKSEIDIILQKISDCEV